MLKHNYSKFCSEMEYSQSRNYYNPNETISIYQFSINMAIHVYNIYIENNTLLLYYIINNKINKSQYLGITKEQFIKYLINSCTTEIITITINKVLEYCDFDTCKYIISLINNTKKIEILEIFKQSLEINNYKIVEYLFKEYNIRDIDKLGNNLRYAANQNNFEIVKFLVEHGVNINNYYNSIP